MNSSTSLQPVDCREQEQELRLHRLLRTHFWFSKIADRSSDLGIDQSQVSEDKD